MIGYARSDNGIEDYMRRCARSHRYVYLSSNLKDSTILWRVTGTYHWRSSFVFKASLILSSHLLCPAVMSGREYEMLRRNTFVKISNAFYTVAKRNA
jgi:hypothetical protein